MGRSSIAAALVVVTAPLYAPPAAEAQIPLYQLPKDDFIWNWGDTPQEAERGFTDLDIRGSEASFNCELTARLRVSSTMGPQEVNQLENDLRGRLDFVYAVSETMSYLEQMRSLDWARLDCKKYQGEPIDAAERAERESRAREKMQRELDRRRARSASKDAAE